jgi:hypothetical protein
LILENARKSLKMGTVCFLKGMTFAENAGLHNDPSWKKGYEERLIEMGLN